MDSVLRAVAIYLVLLVLFKVAGRRTLAEPRTKSQKLIRTYPKTHANWPKS